MEHRKASRRAGCLLLIGIILATGGVRAAGTLYFVDLFKPDHQSGTIRAIRTDTGQVDTVRSVGCRNPAPGVRCHVSGLRALALDPSTRYLYWSDVYSRSFSCKNLKSGRETPILSGAGAGLFPSRMVIHAESGRMIWGDQSLHEIRSANLDGSDVRILFDARCHYSRGLVLDSYDRIYWTGPRDVIRRATLDGSEAEILIEDRGKISDLAIDPVRNRLYFVDIKVDTIFVATLDGKHIRPFVKHRPEDDVRALGVDPSNGDLYWSEEIVENRNRIRKRCAKTGIVNLVGPDEGFGNIGSFVFVPDSEKAVTPAPRSARRDQVAGQLRPAKVLMKTDSTASTRSGGLEVSFTPDGTLSLQFESVPGKRYQIQFSDDLQVWQNAGASLRAGATVTAWQDHEVGGSRADPGAVRRRFYRVVELP